MFSWMLDTALDSPGKTGLTLIGTGILSMYVVHFFFPDFQPGEEGATAFVAGSFWAFCFIMGPLALIKWLTDRVSDNKL